MADSPWTMAKFPSLITNGHGLSTIDYGQKTQFPRHHFADLPVRIKGPAGNMRG